MISEKTWYPAGSTKERGAGVKRTLTEKQKKTLSLAAIAKEIQQRGLPPECSVRIAAGLPLTGFGRDKPKFREYLLRSNQPMNYKFEGVEYSITIFNAENHCHCKNEQLDFVLVFFMSYHLNVILSCAYAGQ